MSFLDFAVFNSLGVSVYSKIVYNATIVISKAANFHITRKDVLIMSIM